MKLPKFDMAKAEAIELLQGAYEKVEPLDK